MRQSNGIAQLLIAQYKAQEEEEAALEIREQSRHNRELRQNESELDTLRQSNEELRVPWPKIPRSTSGCFAIATSPLRTSLGQSQEPDVREPSFQTETESSLG